jgi:hypothetical protein
MYYGISTVVDPVTSPSKLYGGGRCSEFARQSAPKTEKNSTVIDRKFVALSITVEFFGLQMFSGALWRANFC